MKYSEFNNSSEYKITIGKKKYSFRNAAKYFLEEKYHFKENEEIPENHLYHKSDKIIEQILSVVKDSDFEIDNNNKIIFTNHIIVKLANKDFLAKNSIHTFEIIEYFKKIKVISNKSKSFPTIYKEQDPNRLTSCFSNVDLRAYVQILDFRDEILNIILKTSSEEERELYLYYYMSLFSIIKYKEDVYTHFIRNKIYNLEGKLTLIFEKKYSDEYSTVEVVYFDKYLNEVLKDVFFNESENLFDMTDHYFQEDLNFYKKRLNAFLKENYEKITGFNIDNYSKGKFKKLIRDQIEVECQFNNTPFHATLHNTTLYPKTNYLEIMKLFPDIIKDKHYEQIELENVKLQKTKRILDEDDFVEMDVNDYMNINTDAYIEFRNFRAFNKVQNKKDYASYVTRLEKFILKHRDSFAFPQMFSYVRHYISRSRFADEGNLGSKTIYVALCILFNSCFKFIIKEGKIDETVEELIKAYIDTYKKSDTINKYTSIIDPFLNLFGLSIGVNNKDSVVYARKSLIFKKELDQIFEALVEEDSTKYNLELTTDESRFIIYQRFVFCMLMYYSGLRESELWSRMVRDVYIFDDEITIDVNRNILVKKFKTYSAKRRVDFTIDDVQYLKIFKEYLALVENRKMTYLFPQVSKSKKILKKDVQKISYFLTCNNVIQTITRRYTSLHSLRHTYVTKNIRKLIMKNKKQKQDIYNLVNMIGHLGPDVTLRFYSHIDYILYYDNIELF